MQALSAQGLVFVRLFDTTGKKIDKGYLFATSDSSITLYKGNNKQDVLVTQLGFIKTKHSLAHRIGRVALRTAGVIAVIPAFVYIFLLEFQDSDGFITYPKNKHPNPDAETPKKKLHKKYIINGSLKEWKAQKILLEPFL